MLEFLIEYDKKDFENFNKECLKIKKIKKQILAVSVIPNIIILINIITNYIIQHPPVPTKEPEPFTKS